MELAFATIEAAPTILYSESAFGLTTKVIVLIDAV
jgi:hypothetical protein